MKTPLGMEVDVGAGHIVLDGFPAPHERGTAPLLLGPCLLWRRSPISATAELLFQYGGRPLSCICCTRAWTTHKEHLVAIIVVTNSVKIDSVVLIIHVFRFCEFDLQTPFHAPKMGFWGI